MLAFVVTFACAGDQDCLNGGVCQGTTCQCQLGFSGDSCEKQYCSISLAEDGTKTFCQGSGTCDPAEQKCVCKEGFVSSGFNCVVEKAVYLNHTPSYVFLSIGCVLLAVGVFYIIWQYRRGNTLANPEKNLAPVDIE